MDKKSFFSSKGEEFFLYKKLRFREILKPQGFSTRNWATVVENGPGLAYSHGLAQKMESWTKNFFFDRNLKSDSHLPTKFWVICFIESPLKVMKNVFYFILRALLVLKIFKLLSRRFGHLEKMA